MRTARAIDIRGVYIPDAVVVARPAVGRPPAREGRAPPVKVKKMMARWSASPRPSSPSFLRSPPCFAAPELHRRYATAIRLSTWRPLFSSRVVTLLFHRPIASVASFRGVGELLFVRVLRWRPASSTADRWSATPNDKSVGRQMFPHFLRAPGPLPHGLGALERIPFYD